MLRKIFRKKKAEVFYKKSYSQDGEDMILASLFDDMGGKPTGFFIDIGAHHPFRFSNTAYFYETGWRGINVEPTPEAAALFELHRKNDINLNIGIGGKPDELIFYCFDEPALNSFNKQLSEERHTTTNYNITEKLIIPIYPLSKVLDKYLPKHQKIDFMNVDVEGLDLEVLASNNWDKYVPEFILAEDLGDTADSEVYKFLVGKGYVMIAKTQRTMIFKYSKNVNLQ